MKNIRAILIISLACALQACHHSSMQISTSDTGDSSATTDTSSTLNLAVDKEDSDFAVDAANGNATEIALGNLAVKNGRSKKVKNFGMMMVKDHGKTNIKLMALSKAKDLNLPAQPDSTQQKMIDGLSKKTGDAFDKQYINMMIEDHKKDIMEFTTASTKVQDPDLKNFAIKTLPVLKTHLDAITAIYDSMDH